MKARRLPSRLRQETRTPALSAIPRAAALWALWLLGMWAIASVAPLLLDSPSMPGVVQEGFLWLLRSWDYGRYAQIVARGYLEDGVEPNYAFYPLWPLILSIGSSVAPLAVVAGALAVPASLAAFLGVALLNPDGHVQRTIVALICFPGSFALALWYPDSLALATAAWACLLALRGHVAAAALLGAVTGALRPDGILLALPLFALGRRDGRRGAQLLALAPVAGAAAANAFFWIRSGAPLATARAQDQFQRNGPADLPAEVLRIFEPCAPAW